jgi:hypothetical protein
MTFSHDTPGDAGEASAAEATMTIAGWVAPGAAA